MSDLPLSAGRHCADGCLVGRQRDYIWLAYTRATLVIGFTSFIASNVTVVHGGPAEASQRIAYFTWMLMLTLHLTRVEPPDTCSGAICHRSDLTALRVFFRTAKLRPVLRSVQRDCLARVRGDPHCVEFGGSPTAASVVDRKSTPLGMSFSRAGSTPTWVAPSTMIN